MSGSDPKVLVVDDDKRIADLYSQWLSGEYEVDTAYGGEEAIEKVNEDVDVMLLDRRMPGYSGDQVLDEIRDRGFDTKVVMVTAVDPDFDVIEMGFDDYLVKPVLKEGLQEEVTDMLELEGYGEKVNDFFTLSQKVALLEAEKSEYELEKNEEYQELKRKLEEKQQETEEEFEGVGETEDFEDMYKGLSDD